MIETITYIHHSLKDVYPPEEIRSFTRLIMEHVCGIQPYQLLMGKGKELSGMEAHTVREMAERLRQGEPVQYVVGQTSFCGLTFRVDQRALIPRPETEELVACILKDYEGKKARILDIGTGSGCIAVTLARKLPGSEVTAIDVSEDALNLARENAQINEASVSFLRTDILDRRQDGKVGGPFDLIVSNPPYVRESEKAGMERNVLLYEPAQALFVPDDDPMVFYRAIARFAGGRLQENGSLYFEINAQLGRETLNILAAEGYAKQELIRDLSGKDRIIKAQL
ncbi:MAG: peptide chain release factor N(5)-glutamine methyltransferase [Tannerellaceae bacterium]|jgi:release factor glutamine methyltransferase|nr:peptide chain release factor N(5)-glutamine methyltransferase [Tannerellaceae bacterium]